MPFDTKRNFTLQLQTTAESSEYQCFGSHKSSTNQHMFTKTSNKVSLTVSVLNTLLYAHAEGAEENKAQATLTADQTIIPVDGSVTLTCSVEGSDWKYYWFERVAPSAGAQPVRNNEPDKAHVSEGGRYRCRGGRGENPRTYTEYSDEVTIHETVSDRVTVTLQPNWTQIFSGEKITLRCVIEGGRRAQWQYEWRTPSSNTYQTHTEAILISGTQSDSGEYSCMGRSDYFLTQWSAAIKLSVSQNKAQATLTADQTIIPVDGSVTLTCSVEGSDWKYYWFERVAPSAGDQPVRNNEPDKAHVSEGGRYRCRGGRGENPRTYTEYSDEVTIWKTVPSRAVLTPQPNWSLIFSGETITVRCEIEGRRNTEWTYQWRPARLNTPPTNNEYRIESVTAAHSGLYSCKGVRDSYFSTDWSNDIRVTVSHKPQPVLTVSPSWLSPGDSVTLSCSVKDPSAGWRFFWYKAVPKLPGSYYSYELLPDSINGTEQDSYIVHGQTHTAGYVCRAGRGDPVYYTDYSESKFVWSGDFQSSVSLTVSPDRVQHFTSDSVSLNCEGNSSEWRVRRLPEDRYPSYSSYCSYWGTMTGSSCDINTSPHSDAVYWCESGSGELSNAVNITVQNGDIILVSPVHPVTEGDSVSLSCKVRRKKIVSDVFFFYRNEKLIQNDTRRELNISAVLKSDEGFYKCQHLQDVSQQSWMAVSVEYALSRPESSSFPILLIVGPVCGIVLIVLLILFYRHRQSKGSGFIRPSQSESTNQAPDTNHMSNQNEAQRDEYSTLLHGDTCVYESIKGSEDTGQGDARLYESVKGPEDYENGRQREPEERSVYSNVKI